MQLNDLERDFYKVRFLLMAKLENDCYRNIISYLDYMFRYNVISFDARIQHKLNHDMMRSMFCENIIFFTIHYNDKNNVPIWYHSGYYTEGYQIQTQYIICLKCGNYLADTFSENTVKKYAACYCEHNE